MEDTPSVLELINSFLRESGHTGSVAAAFFVRSNAWQRQPPKSTSRRATLYSDAGAKKERGYGDRIIHIVTQQR